MSDEANLFCVVSKRTDGDDCRLRGLHHDYPGRIELLKSHLATNKRGRQFTLLLSGLMRSASQ